MSVNGETESTPEKTSNAEGGENTDDKKNEDKGEDERAFEW